MLPTLKDGSSNGENNLNNDLKSSIASNHTEISHHEPLSHKTSTSSSSSSAKRKFIVLTRLFKPWKWKRKKKSEKSAKGKLIVR